ncbi:hypothetical protein CsSME_00051845 [Camellia sinensis var. sinensis]
MNLTLSHFVSHLLLFFVFLFLLFSSIPVSSSSSDEVRSLLKLKKVFLEDPLRKVFNSWNQLFTNPNSCPSSFYDVDCDINGNVTSISLDRLLKFFTLGGLKMLKI